MQETQLRIQQSNRMPKSGWLAWVNVLAFSGAVFLMLVAASLTVHLSEKSLQANVVTKLETILRIESEAIRQWVASQKRMATFVAAEPLMAELIQAAENGNKKTPKALRDETFPEYLTDVAKKLGGKSCVLVSHQGDLAASSENGEMWFRFSGVQEQLSRAIESGSTEASNVFFIGELAKHTGDNGSTFAMIVAAPIQHPVLGGTGCLGIGYDVKKEFTRILFSSRSDQTGETIAIAADGRLISESRFNGDADQMVFLPPADSKLFFEKSAAIVTRLSGFPDQRGVQSAFASRWLPEIGIGLVSKIDLAEANAPIVQMRYFVWTMLGLFAISTASALLYRWHAHRLWRLNQQADFQRKRLGAYDLENKIGEGGMGVVYKGKHALLRRPTAIKILPLEKSSQDAIERFEREVKFTSQLKHPNTISIFDYGRSENGLFYYAMELLDGFDLNQLVQLEGPIADGRVLHILRQVCESLREAHQQGLIHRDIKPANVMLCDRGGAFDMVKVLDFGMVHDQGSQMSTVGEKLSGTPTYMAPECFTQRAAVGPQVDIFAVGAVGFFLATGRELFDAVSFRQLLRQHQEDIGVATCRKFAQFEKRSGHTISECLAELITKCVQSSPKKRIASIEELLKVIQQCSPTVAWDHLQAQQWWHAHRRKPNSLFGNVPTKSGLDQEFALSITQVFDPSTSKRSSSSDI